MKSTTLRLPADPLSGEPLSLEKDPTGTEWLSAPNTGGRYPIRDGMPIFISTADISGENAKYQKLYDRLAPFYDLSVRGYAWLRGHSERDRLTEYLQELEIHPGDQVLETSIGTGRNVHYLPPEAQYYGVDISWGMLQRCRRSAPGWNRDVELFQCGAEKLCFHDEAFDVVFHVGGINFFNDRGAAIREMLRVAKPGAKLIIVDETEILAKHASTVPGAGSFYNGRPRSIAAPIDLLLPEATNVQCREVAGGDLYCLSFYKSGNSLTK